LKQILRIQEIQSSGTRFCVVGLGQKDPVSVCQSFMSSWIDFTMAMAYHKNKS